MELGASEVSSSFTPLHRVEVGCWSWVRDVWGSGTVTCWPDSETHSHSSGRGSRRRRRDNNQVGTAEQQPCFLSYGELNMLCCPPHSGQP